MSNKIFSGTVPQESEQDNSDQSCLQNLAFDSLVTWKRNPDYKVVINYILGSIQSIHIFIASQMCWN